MGQGADRQSVWRVVSWTQSYCNRTQLYYDGMQLYYYWKYTIIILHTYTYYTYYTIYIYYHYTMIGCSCTTIGNMIGHSCTIIENRVLGLGLPRWVKVPTASPEPEGRR